MTVAEVVYGRCAREERESLCVAVELCVEAALVAHASSRARGPLGNLDGVAVRLVRCVEAALLHRLKRGERVDAHRGSVQSI